MYSIAEIEITEEMTFMEFSEAVNKNMVKLHDDELQNVIENSKHAIQARSPIMKLWKRSKQEETKRLYELFCNLWRYIQELKIFGKASVVFSDVSTISDYHILANVYVPTKVNHS